MLCTSCQNKPHCLAAQLAEGDAALAQLLGQLKRCSLKPPRRDLGQRVKAYWQLLRTALRQAVWRPLRLRPR
ncbi:MAG: hypothetical protein KME47_08295 [Nodosilinea sp. WJT8-NPBG4]|nr:hypothetical protein [Nodosilinea sp. WJT8-NPBG4]